METKSITDYIQSLQDIIPALQMGLFPDPTIGKVFSKFGETINLTVSSSIISSLQNQDPFNDDGNQLYISSENDTDNQAIYIEGVEYGTGNPVSETITLTGQTAKALTTSFRTMYTAYNANGTEILGDVWVGTEAIPLNGKPATNNAYCHVPATYHGHSAQQALTTIFTVPTGYTGFLIDGYGSVGKGKDSEFVPFVRAPGKVWRYADSLFVFEASFQKQRPWVRLETGVDFKVTGITSQGTQQAALTYTLVLLRNDMIGKFRPLSWR
jgi:hypothetical protein